MKQKRYTLYGFLAVFIWSTGSALCRTLTESWGIAAGALCNLVAGVIAIFYQYRRCKFAFIKGRSPRFWITCGILYVTYVVTNYASSIFAVDRQQIMALTLIKSAWPVLAYVFLFILEKRRPTSRFWCKVGLLTIGLLVSNLIDENGRLYPMDSFLSCLPAILIGLASSVAWALYSNALGRFSGGSKGDAGGLFMISASLIVSGTAVFEKGTYTYALTPSFLIQFLFNSVVSVFIANILWNLAVVKGDRAKVFSFSNLLPVLSVGMSSLILGEKISIPVFIGSLLVLAGTVIATEPAHKKRTVLPSRS